MLALRANDPQLLQNIEQWLVLEFFDGGHELLNQLMEQLTQLKTDDNDQDLLVLMQKIRKQLSKHSL